MSATSFALPHCSGLWDAPAVQWAALTGRLCALGSIVTFTETTTHKPHGPKGWLAYHGEQKPGAFECSVLWDGAVWEQIGKGFAEPVSKTTFALGNGKPRPQVHLVGVVLRHRATGHELIVSVVHTPSAVEAARGLVHGARRAVAYTETLAGITRVRKSLRKAHPKAAFVVNGDWNLNLRLPWVSPLLRAGLRGLKSSWRHMPKSGTHGSGRRVIDGGRHSRRLVTKRGSTVLKRQAHFDHSPVLTHYAFKGRP